MIRAVVFDFDGVIANSEPLHYRGLSDVLANVGVHLTESDYYTRYLGYDDAGALRCVSDDRALGWTALDIEALVARKAERLEELERSGSLLFPGAADAVRRLAERCPLSIASGALGAEIRRILEREGLTEYFVEIVAAEDTAAGKPDPEPYLRAVDAMSIALSGSLLPDECVAVEDSVWGLESARRAGLRTVGVTHTYPADRLDLADVVISHLDALTWELIFAIGPQARRA